MDIVVAFFLLGVIAHFSGSKVRVPEALYQSLTIILMIAIGLKGGIALAKHGTGALVWQSAWVVAFGFTLPLLAFAIARWIGQLPRMDAAALAAHYGSVSVATYAVAVALMESREIAYEPYFPLFLVLLEMPAIVVGLMLASGRERSVSSGAVLHEAFFNPGMMLMAGSLLIGYLWSDQIGRISPLFFDLFGAVLALFLLEMGLLAASRLSAIGGSLGFLVSFGVAMPLIGAALGGLLGAALGLSVGGVGLLAVLGGSASYIAVPAAIRVALPEANLGLCITASLGITFPFNVLVGIPFYLAVSHQLLAAH